MSQDEFDDWNALPTSIQDLLFQSIASVELGAISQTSDSINIADMNKENRTKKHQRFKVYEDTNSKLQDTHTNKAIALRERSMNQERIVENYNQEKHGNIVKQHVPSPNSRYTIPAPITQTTSLADKLLSPLRPTDNTLPTIPFETAKNDSREDENDKDDEGDDEWTHFEVDFSSVIGKLEEVESTSTFDKTIPTQSHQPDQCNPDALLNQFGGFVTAGSKSKLTATSLARQKALAMFSDDHPKSVASNAHLAETNTPLTDSVEEKPTKRISVEYDPKNEELTCMLDPKPSGTPSTGFQTGTGKSIKPISNEAFDAALNILKDPSEILPDKRSSSAETEPSSQEFKYEDILSRYGGFRMGSGKMGIPVSSEAKRQAISLFHSDSYAKDLLQSTQSSQDTNDHESSVDTPLPVQSQTPSSPSPEVSPPRHLGSGALLRRSTSSLRNPLKPFKSPLVGPVVRVQETEQQRGTEFTRARGSSVFDLTVHEPREQLRDLGPPTTCDADALLATGLDTDIIFMTSKLARQYEFNGWGPSQAEMEMLKAGALSRFLSLAWVQHHYGCIVWKMACMIRQFPDKTRHWWCHERVLGQLLYRYEREFNQGHRSVLKKIIEMDDIPAKHMVLTIASIEGQESVMGQLSREGNHHYRLMLTDGWYHIYATCDARMARAISRKSLRVGSKLSICGAQMIGDRTARSPLCITPDTCLSISSNSCVRARWYTKLGSHTQRLVTRSLATLSEDGGMITSVDVVVCRRYPLMYTYTQSDGTTITHPVNADDGMLWSLEGFQQSDTNTNRNDTRVSSYFRVRLCDANTQTPVMMTLLVSNANEVQHMDVCEGQRYRIMFITPYTPRHKRFPDMECRTTRYTQWEVISDKKATLPVAYIPRHVTSCADLGTLESGNDVDIAVVVLRSNIQRNEGVGGKKNVRYYILLVSDASKAVCQIRLRTESGSLHDIEGQVVGFMNLRLEAYDAKYNIAHLRTNDETEIVTRHASTETMLQAMRQLRTWKQTQPHEVQALRDRVKAIMDP